MKIVLRLSVCVALATASHAPSAQTVPAPRATGPEKVEAGSPANAGRRQLVDSLNRLAFEQTAARRETVSRLTTRAQAEARQRHVRATILSLLGSLPERIPLNARTTGSTQQDGFRVDKVLFDSQPNFPVTALLYVPEGAGTFPAIVIAPGHGATGKVSDIAFATAFARAGFVVLSYDPIGQGERLQYLDPTSPADKPQSLASRPTGEHGEAGLQPTLIGDSLARYFLWDGMRAVDYLQSLPQVDPKRIGAFGCSGGGTMTALLGALDSRIAATGVACYTTSFDALLTSATGVQDTEQSSANFISSGLDFPDWIELAAPRPYAIIATTGDMFPFAGVVTTGAEARSFYKVFGADGELALIKGPGGHGNLGPVRPQILRFFADHLHPDAAFAANLPPLTDPFDAKANPPRRPGPFPPPPPASFWQVTPTGQLSSSYPHIATVFTLNQARAARIAPLASGASRKPALTLAQLQKAVRDVTHAPLAVPPLRGNMQGADTLSSGNVEVSHLPLQGDGGIFFSAHVYAPRSPGRHAAVLVLLPDDASPQSPGIQMLHHVFDLAHAGNVVLTFTPRPSPPGSEETKAAILGDFYLTGLRAQLVGKTLIGMRVEDVLAAVGYLAARIDVDAANLRAEASGHLGLVLLHAAILDPRLKHVSIDHALASYRGLLDDPLPVDAPQDMLPGVLLHYDIPDLVRAPGSRLTWSSPMSGADSLASRVPGKP